jgi:hypothetical protein
LLTVALNTINLNLYNTLVCRKSLIKHIYRLLKTNIFFMHTYYLRYTGKTTDLSQVT